MDSHRFPTALALGFYGLMLGAAALWSWLRGDPAILVWTPAPGPGLPAAAAAGLGSGLLVVLLSRLAVRAFAWARAMERTFIRLLGPLSAAEVGALAVASAIGEEALFRGAMQPSLGLVPTAVLFGLLHTGGHRLLPWTVMALVMGFALGGLASWSRGLVAPVLCHCCINWLNLQSLALKARKPNPAAR